MKIITLFLITLMAPQALWGQELGREAEEIERRRKARQDVEKAAALARDKTPAGPEVTFSDILKDPDNIGLNFRYARSQVARGKLKSASATLERILMVNPNLPKVRLFYAMVLFRLDNLDDAEREFSTLKDQPMTKKTRAELDRYVKAVRKRRRLPHWNFSVASGFDFDENRNSAPNTGKRLLTDIEIVLDEASTRQNDTTKVMTAGFGVNHTLGYQAGHSVFASANYYRAEQTKLRTLNIQSISGSLGATYKTDWLDITPSYDFNHTLLAETTYLRSHGAKLRLNRKVNDRVNVYWTAGYTRQDYNRTQVVPTAPERNGEKYEGGVGFDAVIGPASRVGLGFTHTSQGAEAKYNAYFRETLNFNYTRVFSGGRFLLATISANFDKYNAPDTTISAKPRDDHTWRSRLTFGTPLGHGFLLTLAYEYFHADSNLLNNSYTNNKVSSLVTYRWSN